LFRLGAAPDSWDDTVKWAKSKSYELATIEKAGLIIRREGADGYYDRFRGRLMFPICDEQGRVIGFSGRILTGDEKTAKYVNSPETPIFTKSKVFFGLDKSKRAILDAGFAIVCEGQLDLIACFMAGVQNIVAPQGTAFTDQHARILKRYADEVVLCFDSDAAGQNAAVRSLDSLLASGMAVRVALVPPPHDPDSFIKSNGGEMFQKLIGGAEGFFDYYLNRLCASHDITTDKGRLAVLRAMAEAVNQTGNVVLIDKHAQKTALRLGVAADAVRAEFKKSPVAQPASAVEDFDPADESESDTVRPALHELWLLKLVLKHESGLAGLEGHLDPEWIQHAVVKGIVSRCLAAHADGSWLGLAPFLDGFESAEARGLITEGAAEEREIPNPDQQLADLTLRLRNQFLDRQLAELSHRLSQPNLSEAENLQLLQQQQQLRQLKRQPLLPLGEAH
jgi:DNA primase